mgnify:CR=1 FL=1
MAAVPGMGSTHDGGLKTIASWKRRYDFKFEAY